MGMDEKDRFGDKLREVERGREDEYFAKRDRELLAKLRAQKGEEAERTVKQMAHMRCPSCGERLHERRLLGVTVAECPACKGLWLDQGELQTLAEREEEGWLVRWFRGDREV